jgi:hypothetical protein
VTVVQASAVSIHNQAHNGFLSARLEGFLLTGAAGASQRAAKRASTELCGSAHE